MGLQHYPTSSSEASRGASRAGLLTPPGSAAIAVVRLAGPAVGEFLRRHFARPVAPDRPVHGELRDDGCLIDDPVVVLASDGSFADLSLHGGPWIVRSVLELAARAGFAVIEPLPVPLPPGLLCEEMTPLDREIASYLPLARTELAVRVLLAQREAWRRLAGAEPGALSASEFQQIIEDRSLHWLLHPPRVAIIGAPNVGKSTLANQLFAQERSITADLPGTTRDWVGELANIDGLPVLLVDTPGLRDTADPLERQAIAASGTQVQHADLLLLVLDAAQPFAPDQQRLLDAYPQALRLLNKCDLPSQWDAASAGAIHLVARTGAGLPALRQAILAHFGCASIDIGRPRWWTERQRAALAGPDGGKV